MTPDNPQSTPSPEPFRIELIEANSKLARCERDLATAQQDLLLKSQGIDAWRDEAHKREAQLAAANAEIARLSDDNSKLIQQDQLVQDAIPAEFDGSEENFGTIVGIIVDERHALRAEVVRLTRERDEASQISSESLEQSARKLEMQLCPFSDKTKQNENVAIILAAVHSQLATIHDQCAQLVKDRDRLQAELDALRATAAPSGSPAPSSSGSATRGH